MHFRNNSAFLLVLLTMSFIFSKSFSVSNQLVQTWISTISIEFPIIILVLFNYKSLNSLNSRGLGFNVKLHQFILIFVKFLIQWIESWDSEIGGRTLLDKRTYWLKWDSLYIWNKNLWSCYDSIWDLDIFNS